MRYKTTIRETVYEKGYELAGRILTKMALRKNIDRLALLRDMAEIRYLDGVAITLKLEGDDIVVIITSDNFEKLTELAREYNKLIEDFLKEREGGA